MRTLVLALLATVALASHSSAAILTFTDRDAFLAALSSSYEEDFSSYAGTYPSSLNFSGNGFSYTISGGTSALVAPQVGGDRSMSLNTASEPLSIFGFSSGVNAVGGYFYFDNDGGAIQTLTSGSITVVNGIDPNVIVPVNAPTSVTNFFGFISTSGDLTSVTFNWSGENLGWQNVDDLIVGTSGSPIPEPSTFALLGAGLIAAAALRRRRSA